MREVFLSNFHRSPAERLAKCGIVFQPLHDVDKPFLNFNDFRDARILVRPTHSRTLRRTVDQERHADRRAIRQLAWKRHLHVASVSGVE